MKYNPKRFERVHYNNKCDSGSDFTKAPVTWDDATSEDDLDSLRNDDIIQKRTKNNNKARH